MPNCGQIKQIKRKKNYVKYVNYAIKQPESIYTCKKFILINANANKWQSQSVFETDTLGA